MTRDQERLARSRQEPIVPGLPDAPGIQAAMRLTPDLGLHLRGLADALLVHDFPGATLRRAKRSSTRPSMAATLNAYAAVVPTAMSVSIVAVLFLKAAQAPC